MSADNTLFGVQARLGSLRDLCFTLAHAHDAIPTGDKQLVGAFYALGNGIDAEVEALIAIEK